MRNNPQIKFGTDGWRGVIADDFTFENVKIVSQAISDWINLKLTSKNSPRKVVVGFDTRFLSQEYAQIVSSVLAGNGIDVILSKEVIPTPIVSFTVKQRGLDAGIMITASHNPAKFNGIKIKTSNGASAPESVTKIVEASLFKNKIKYLDFNQALKKRKIKIESLSKNYIDFIRRYINFKKIKTQRFKLLADIMHGSGDSYILKILKGTKIDLTLMRQEVNPTFDGKGPEPVEENLEEIIKRMKTKRFDLGLVLDGDADRIAAVSNNGEFIHPQQILSLLILHLVQDRKLKGGIVKTIAGTTQINRITKKLNLKLYETSVGFKYISQLMNEKDILVGGEEAGGIGFKNYIPERDGILAGLLLLEMMVYRKKSMDKIISQMEDEFGRFYYLRLNLRTKKANLNLDKTRKIKTILGKTVSQIKDFDGIKLILEDKSWLMFRKSGTEPLVRIYCESTSLKQAKALLAFGENFLNKL